MWNFAHFLSVCVVSSKFSCFLSLLKKHAGLWTGYVVLSLGMNECESLRIHCALQWTIVPLPGCIPTLDYNNLQYGGQCKLNFLVCSGCTAIMLLCYCAACASFLLADRNGTLQDKQIVCIPSESSYTKFL